MRGFHRYLAITSFTLTCLCSHAAIPPQQLDLSVPPNKPVQNIQADIDIAKIIPTNLQPGQKEEQLGMKIVDYSINQFTNGDFFKNTEIGKAAKGFEESLKTDVHLGGDPEKGEVSHSVNMQIEAFNQKAWLHYRGYTDLQVTYKTNDHTLDLEMNENLGRGTHLVVGHNVQNQYSRAALSWNW